MLRLAPRRVLLSAVVIFMSTEPGLGLLSDYKTCGDPQCESLLSRVLATRDHKARDCRFLSFNRGDSIFVYHKLSGKRDDLWAGSIGKHFGYFPKDAVEVEEVYAPKEVQISTKEQDFFCLDGNGGFIESEITFSEREEEAQKAPTGELEYPERSGSERDSLNDFTNNEGTNSDSEVQLPPDIEEPKAAEQGGSYWLGSGVTGWLGLGGQKDDSATDETEGQDSFKSRKLALTDNMLQEEAGWLGGRLSNAFGFSKGSEEIQPDEEDEKDRDQSLVTSTDRDAAEGLNANEEKVTEAPSRSWLKFGVPEVLKFGQRSSDENAEGNGDLTEAERYPSEEKEVGSPSQDFSVSRGGEDLERTEKDIEVDITHDKEDKKGENAGWYSSVYNKIAGFHRAEDDTANDIHLSQESLGTGSQEEAEEVKDDTEQESQSVLSFGGMKNMFGTLTSRFQQQSSDANKEPTSADEEYVLSKEVSQESNISETKNIPDVQNGSEEQTSKLEENDQPDIQPDAQKVQDGELIGSNLEENLETVDLPLASDLELKTSSEGHVEIPEDTEKDIDRNSESSTGHSLESENQALPPEVGDHFKGDNLGSRDNNESVSVLQGVVAETNTEKAIADDIEQKQPSATESILTNPSTEVHNKLLSEVEQGEDVFDLGSPNAFEHVSDQKDEFSQPENKHEFSPPERNPLRDEPAQILPANTTNTLSKEDANMEYINPTTHESQRIVDPHDSAVEYREDDSSVLSVDQRDQPREANVFVEEEQLVADSMNQSVAATDSSSAPKEEKHINQGAKSETNSEIIQQPENEQLIIGGGKENADILKAEHAGQTEQLFQESMDTLQVAKQSDTETVFATETLLPVTDESTVSATTDGGISIKESTVVFKETTNPDIFPEKTSSTEIKIEYFGTVYNQDSFSEPRLKVEDASVDDEALKPDDSVVNERTEKFLDRVAPTSDVDAHFQDAENQTITTEQLEVNERRGREETPHVPVAQADEKIQKPEVLTTEHSGDATLQPPINELDFLTPIHMEKPLSQSTEDGRVNQEEVFNDTSSLEQSVKNPEHDDPKPPSQPGAIAAHGKLDLTSRTVEPPGVILDKAKSEEDHDGLHKIGIVTDNEGGGCKTSEGQQTDGDNSATGTDGGGLLPETPDLLYDTNKEDTGVGELNVLDQSLDIHDEQTDDNRVTVEGESVTELKDSLSAHSDEEGSQSSQSQRESDTKNGDSHALATDQNNITQLGTDFDIEHMDKVNNDTDSHDPLKGNSSLIMKPLDQGPETSVSKEDEEGIIASPVQASDSLLHETTPQLQSAPHPREQADKPAKVLKELKKIQQYMSPEDVQYLLEVFGKHKLLWIEYCLDNTNGDIEGQTNKEDLSLLSDFERALEHHYKVLSASKESNVQGNVKEDGFRNKNTALQSLEGVLSTLKSRYSTEAADVSVNDNPGKPPSHCFTDSCTREKHIDEGAGRGTLQSTASRGSEKTVKSESLRDLGKGDSEIGRVLSLAAQAISEACESAKPSWSSFSQFMQRAVSSLPEDMRPGPDIYGLPWEAVIITAVLGGITILMFFCRSLHSIKSRLYVGKEKKLGQKVAELLEEKCKVLETLSECKQKYDKLEDDLKNGALSDQASERENLQEMCKKLEESNTELLDELDRLEKDFESQKATRSQQDELLAEMQLSLKNMEEEAREQKSQMEQAHTTLKVYEINSERLKKNLQAAKEENCHLQESKDQLLREAEGWDERLNDLAEQMRMCESSRSSMQEDCSNKDKHIKTLTERLLKMKDWDSELEEEADGKDNNGKGAPENGDGLDTHQREKIQKLIHAAKMSADLKSMEEEKNRVFARLADEAKAKEDLKDRIEHLHAEKVLLESESVQFLGDTQKLQQKLQIMTEMYQENELKLHRKLTVEGKERLQKEEKLTRADEKICMAAEELSSYRQRSKELEEELERTKQAYNNQIAAHEKKSHDNWLAARAADRDLTDIKRENSHLRQKMTDAQFKLELVERDPYALDVPGRSLFRGERSPFGPSPLGRPSSETRAFLSPPTLLDGPLRLSPQFAAGPGGKVSRGLPNLADQPVHSEGLDCDRSLDTQRPHSDSGSLSPTWERDWRVHVPPPGYPYTDPGMPYRRPPPGVFPMGPLPPRLPGPAEPHGFSLHPADTPEASFLGNSSASSGAADSDSKDSLPSVPGGLRMPPDADPRMGPGPGPPMRGPFPPPEHRDLFPRRGPYGPPDFYPPRGAPPVGMRGLPPPGMFHQFPPPPPHHMGYQPGRPPPDSVQGPPPRPSPPGSEQSGDQLPPPQDNI
ncbi:cTAGE family member 5 isoform X2 [Amia ocellicauda]|uniref:cTAGE family member 5 isoform X2 n=1 Tax=Amia ocellicauda TaxID=2972642 RepID=UPI003463D78F